MFDVARSCLYAYRERARHIDVERMALRSRVHELFVDPQALGGRAQLCLAGEKQTTMEKLRTMAQHPLAVHPLDVPGDADQEIVNTF